MISRGWWLACALVVGGCGDDSSGGAQESESGSEGTSAGPTSIASAETGSSGPGSSGTAATDPDTGSTGGDADPVELNPLCPEGLPVSFEREADGDPVDPIDILAVTSRYLELLEQLHYFDFVAQNAHGWPEDDPDGYWYASWWSGVGVHKLGGEITFAHGDTGGDNNGLRTGPLIEGACYAYALWQRPEDERLIRAMLRSFIAWMIAMERTPDDPDAPMLSRAFYPESVMVDEPTVSYFIDYSLNRPGIDADPSEYVHVPDNPHYGDIWIKNKRSKDDIGHMLRAVAQLGACEPLFSDDGTREDFTTLRTLYAEWSRKVEDDGWKIATLDKDGELWFPSDLLANFVATGNAECDAMLSMSLLGRGEPGELECGNGIGALDPIIIGATDHNGHILRSFHEAATNNALIVGEHEIATELLGGLAVRIVEGLDSLDGSGPEVPYLVNEDEVDMILHGLAVGVPLTWREVRFMHERIDEAHTGYQTEHNENVVNVFDDSVPDGEYAYRPFAPGIDFRSIGAPLAACASPCVNETTQPLLDCDRVLAWEP